VIVDGTVVIRRAEQRTVTPSIPRAYRITQSWIAARSSNRPSLSRSSASAVTRPPNR
jgi:hypothetical protein